MYMYTYIYTYMYIYIYTHTHTYLHKHTITRTHTHTHTHWRSTSSPRSRATPNSDSGLIENAASLALLNLSLDNYDNSFRIAQQVCLALYACTYVLARGWTCGVGEVWWVGWCLCLRAVVQGWWRHLRAWRCNITHKHTHMCTRTQTHMHTVHTRMYMHTQVTTHTCKGTRTYNHLQPIYIWVHRLELYAHAHTHTHTHKYTLM